jgi:hypothetical protein
MRKEIIEIEAKVGEATKDIKKLFDTMVAAEKEAQKSGETLNKNVKDLGETSKKSAKGVEGISKSVKGIGNAMKVAGIGIIISLFTSLKEVFTSNQKVADLLATVMETVSLVFNEFANVIVGTYEKVSKATGGFDALGKVLMGILKLAITPLKLGFYGITLGLQEAQLMWEKSFFGDKDQNVINQLNSDILKTKLALLATGEDAIKAGKDIASNIGEAIGEVGSFVSEAIEGVSKISISGAYENAKAIVQLKKSAEIAAAVQAGLVEENDRLAEKQRQIRDNDLKSIDERRKANEELLKILKKQEKDMTAQAKLQTAAAAADYNKNQSTENYVALIQAENNEKAIKAQIEGFLSEQQANKIALDKEEIELINSKKEANSNLSIQEKQFAAEQELNEVKKLQALRTALEEEKVIELERLQAKIDSYVEGTQYRLDAENEYALKKQEIDQTILTNTKETNKAIIEEDKVVAEAKAAIMQSQLDNIAGGFALLGQLAGKNKALQAATIIGENAVGIAKQIIATRSANALVTAKYALLPGGVALAAAEKAMNNVSLGIGIATSVAATAKALSALGKGGSAGGGSQNSGGGGAVQSPSFNVVGQSGTNQLAQSIGNQATKPIKAYVVSKEMSSQQEQDRNTQETATFG